MPQLIQITNDARQTFTTVLNNQRVRLVIYYLDDELDVATTGWFADLILLTQMPQPITLGERLNTFTFFAQDIVSDFTGAIIPVATTYPIPALTDRNPWGVTHQLIYLSQNEINTLDTIEASLF